jgi:hypothetical protein
VTDLIALTTRSTLLLSAQAPKKRDITSPLLLINGSISSALAGSFATNSMSLTTENGTFQCWGLTTKPSSPLKKLQQGQEVLATFADKSPAVVLSSVGKGKSLHFFFFPGTSSMYGYTANITGHRGSGGLASDWTLRALIWNATTVIGVAVPPVRTSSLEVEAPLLAGPTGSVVTLLNWARTEFNATNGGNLAVQIVLGFTPSKVESVEHGVLATVPLAAPEVGVALSVPLAAADFLLFYK